MDTSSSEAISRLLRRVFRRDRNRGQRGAQAFGAGVGSDPGGRGAGCRSHRRLVACGLAEALAALAPDDQQAQRAADHLLDLLATRDINDPWTAGRLAEALTALAPDDQQAQRAADHLLDLLANPDIATLVGRLPDALVALAPDDQQAQRAITLLLDLRTTPDIDPWAADRVAGALVALAPAAPRAQTLIDRGLNLLTTYEFRRPLTAIPLTNALVALAKADPDPQTVIGRGLDLLTTSYINPLAPDDQQAERATTRLLDLFATPDVEVWEARSLAWAVVALAEAVPGHSARVLELLASPSLSVPYGFAFTLPSGPHGSR
jgi:hypothetical protein